MAETNCSRHSPNRASTKLAALSQDFVSELEPRGVAVILEATHTCMAIRGIRKPGSVCTTSAMRGVFRANLTTRSEFLSLIRPGK